MHVFAEPARFRTFVVVWAGQSISLIGSTLSGFALGIYVYRLTGSATTLGLVFAFALLPSIVASPITGPLVDRWGPRRALLVSNTGAMAVSSALAILLYTGNFAVWHVYPVVAAMSVLSALSIPAMAALVPMVVPQRRLDRANGMRMFAVAASEVLAPVAGGFLLLGIGIRGIVLIDLVSFGLALATVFLVRIPRVTPQADAKPARLGTLLAEFRIGWQYVTARRGLYALLLFFCAINFSAGFIDLLISPLVLAFATPGTLGVVLSVGGIGMIVASLVVSVRGGPRRQVRGILVATLVLAAATVIGASRPNAVLIAAAAFVFMGTLAVIVTTNQSIWQTKVEPQLLGRVGAALNMVTAAPQVIAYAVAGLAADRIFAPLAGRAEDRSPLLTFLIGHGQDRGMALLMMVVGALIAVTVAVAATSRRLLRLEDELPDVIPAPDGPDESDVDAAAPREPAGRVT